MTGGLLMVLWSGACFSAYALLVARLLASDARAVKPDWRFGVLLVLFSLATLGLCFGGMLLLAGWLL